MIPLNVASHSSTIYLMVTWVFLLLLSLLSLPALALRPLESSPEALQTDVQLIASAAQLPPNLFHLETKIGERNEVRLECQTKPWVIRATHTPGERAATIYHALHHLGFLFPHPRRQISPTLAQIQQSCGKSFRWRPLLRQRGFHLHTLHPNEWVHAFFMGRQDIAEEYIRWLARNRQNILDVSLLRVPLSDIQKNFAAPYALAKQLGIHTGVSLGVALQQQRSYKLLNLWQAMTGWGAEKALVQNLEGLMEAVDTSFIVLEAGTSEFTPTNYEKTLSWLNLAASTATKKGRDLFTKVHVSSNQRSEKWGNYNFLPQHADSHVGILPHTVMFYGLNDPFAPMYGNQNFHGIRDFMQKEKNLRPTWYYPETGYWVGMDIDIPLFLTDYLMARAEDMRWLSKQGIPGQLTFTTGHALGGWLYDWTVALLVDADLNTDPLAGLKLLGEDPTAWQAMLNYQHQFFKEQGLIAPLSSANLQDEISSQHRIHARHTLKELAHDPVALKKEVALLAKANKSWPALKPHTPSLVSALALTQLRLEQALNLRLAQLSPKQKLTYIQASQSTCQKAQAYLEREIHDPLNYPDAQTFEQHENPTSYAFGYVYPAATLHFWRREEKMVDSNCYSPFCMNLYNFWRILF